MMDENTNEGAEATPAEATPEATPAEAAPEAAPAPAEGETPAE